MARRARTSNADRAVGVSAIASAVARRGVGGLFDGPVEQLNQSAEVGLDIIRRYDMIILDIGAAGEPRGNLQKQQGGAPFFEIAAGACDDGVGAKLLGFDRHVSRVEFVEVIFKAGLRSVDAQRKETGVAAQVRAATSRRRIQHR